MRVLRQGHRGIIPIQHCNFLIYDETTYKATEPVPIIIERLKQGMLTNEEKLSFENYIRDSQQKMYRQAYNHPIICFFSVYNNGNITYEFDNEKQYSIDEIKKIVQLSGRARSRCKFSKHGPS